MHRQIVLAMLLLTACTTSLGAESLAPALHGTATPGMPLGKVPTRQSMRLLSTRASL